MGVILAFLSAVFYALVFFLSKVFVKSTKNPLIEVFLYQFLAGLFFIPIFIYEKPSVNLSTEVILLTILVTFLYAGFNIFGFKANKYIDVSVSGILSQITGVVAFIGSLIIFKEQLTTMKLIGAGLIVSGNLILYIKQSHQAKINLKGTILRSLSAVLLGIAILVDARNASSYSTSLYGLITYLVPSIWVLLLSGAKISEVKEHFNRNRLGFIAFSLMGTFGFYFLIKSFLLLDKTISVPINSSYSVLVVLLGVILLKEKDNLFRKLIASGIVFAGVVVLGLA